MRRWRRFGGALAVLGLLFAAPPATGRTTQPFAASTIEIQASPLASFDLRDASRRLFGRLQFRGGVVLTSTTPEFGGLSGIRVQPDGERFLAVSDRGNWLRGRIRHEGQRPVAITEAEMAPLLGPDGRPITARRWYDAESLTIDGSTAYVGIERVHQILRFNLEPDGLAARGRPISLPPEARKLPSNAGLEALVVGPRGSPISGALIAFSERALDEAGNIQAFLLGGPMPGMFTVRRTDEFDVTDAAILPQGDILLLERRFSLLRGPGLRIRRISGASIKPGALVDGPVLIEADAGFQIDNMEGLAVHASAQGDIVLTLISDNNFSRLQRTLLLQFSLIDP